MSFGRCLTLLVTLTGIVGCSDDSPAELDNLVDHVWMEDFTHADAVSFLESGGTHYDTQYGRHKDVDSQFVVPLLKRLQQEHQVRTLAFIDDDLNWAWALIVRLPSDSAEQSRIQTFIEEADDEFPGIIETEWGHETLRLSFVDEAENHSTEEPLE